MSSGRFLCAAAHDGRASRLRHGSRSMAADNALRDFIHVDFDRVQSLAAQLAVPAAPAADRTARERLLVEAEAALAARGTALELGPSFDFARWTPETFSD